MPLKKANKANKAVEATGIEPARPDSQSGLRTIDTPNDRVQYIILLIQ